MVIGTSESYAHSVAAGDKAYRRRRGVIRRPFSAHPYASNVNDGGHDAPMGPRDRRLFEYIFWGAALVLVLLILLVILG
jgi:hypothetical protein